MDNNLNQKFLRNEFSFQLEQVSFPQIQNPKSKIQNPKLFARRQKKSFREISRQLSIFFFLLFLTQTGFSQYEKTYSTKSKKAIKFFEAAYRSYNSMKYEEALNYLDMAKKADKKFIEPYLLEANIFEENGYYQKEIDAYKSDRKSTRLNSSHTDISRMPSSA